MAEEVNWKSLTPVPRGEPVRYTDDQRRRAYEESRRRDGKVVHHFELEYLDGVQRDCIGFLGEFGHMAALGLRWDGAVRDNYDSIDDCDLLINRCKVDFKTETIPTPAAVSRLARGELRSTDAYGSRLIHMDQFMAFYHELNRKYDVVIFGAMARPTKRDFGAVSNADAAVELLRDVTELFQLGWVPTEEIQAADYGRVLPNGRMIPFRAKFIHPPLHPMSDLPTFVRERYV